MRGKFRIKLMFSIICHLKKMIKWMWLINFFNFENILFCENIDSIKIENSKIFHFI